MTMIHCSISLVISWFVRAYSLLQRRQFVLENYPVLGLFVIVGIWSSLRYWFDPVNMLQDNGSFERKNWKVKSRISAILLNVTRANGTKFFMWTILILIFGILTLAVSVLGNLTGITSHKYSPQMKKLTRKGQFLYPPKQTLMYPTCNLQNEELNLIDYTFLSTVAYENPTNQREMLDEWFGPGVAELDTKTIKAFRTEMEIPDAEATYGSYGIVSFEDRSVVMVRGTQNAWVSQRNTNNQRGTYSGF